MRVDFCLMDGPGTSRQVSSEDKPPDIMKRRKRTEDVI